jgi:hypothetical protein
MTSSRTNTLSSFARTGLPVLGFQPFSSNRPNPFSKLACCERRLDFQQCRSPPQQPRHALIPLLSHPFSFKFRAIVFQLGRLARLYILKWPAHFWARWSAGNGTSACCWCNLIKKGSRVVKTTLSRKINLLTQQRCLYLTSSKFLIKSKKSRNASLFRSSMLPWCFTVSCWLHSIQPTYRQFSDINAVDHRPWRVPPTPCKWKRRFETVYSQHPSWVTFLRNISQSSPGLLGHPIIFVAAFVPLFLSTLAH